MPSGNTAAAKKAELLAFLHAQVFDPILSSADASETLKKGVRYTIMRIDECDPAGIVQVPLVGNHRNRTKHEVCTSNARRRFHAV